MYVNIEQIKRGVANFIDQEVGMKAVGVRKFFVYFAMPVMNKKIEEYILEMSKNPITKEFFDTNNNVDLDTIYNMGKNAIKKSGQFEWFGILFNENDIDKLYAYIRG